MLVTRRVAPTLAVLATLSALAGSPLVAQNSVAPSPPALGAARGAEVATMRAARKDGAIALDGRLDDVAWQRAEPSRNFTQSWPNPGKPGTDPTEVRVVYDDEAIYVAVRAFDSRPDSIAAQLARRDASNIYSDWIHVIIDSYYDRRTAYRFTVNPKGVMKDVANSNDNFEDANWDAVWEVATLIDSAGWVAEYRIPLSQLRFGNAPAGQERTWGWQVMRDVARRNERVAFSPWVPDGSGFVSRFGDLTGILNIPQPQRLEVLPYASAKVARAPGNIDNPFYKKTDATPNVGADVRYGLPAGLTLTATINPDFGQVEVDPAVVNLSAFESFFPEKRPFFLEGADVFSFGNLRRHNDYGGMTFFYTRRVGRSPTRFPSASDIAYVDMPEQTTIAGAAKVTGRVGPWTVGVLNALTNEEHARVAGADGIIDSATAVEPLTNFFAGRVRRDFRRGHTVIGGMLTTVNRQQSPLFNGYLSQGAGYGGVDFEHRWSRGKYTMSGYSVQTRVNGTPTMITALQRAPARYYHRPDGESFDVDPTRTSLTGYSNALAVSKNGPWFGSLVVKEVSPGYEINDIGFHGRVDYRAVSPFWGYQKNGQQRYTQNWFAGVWSNHTWNFDGTSIFQSVGGSSNATLRNMWSGGVNANFSLPYFNDRLLRGGPIARQPEQRNVNFWLNTDTRKRVWFNPYGNYSWFSDDDSWSANGGVYMETRPRSNVQVTVGPNYYKQFSTAQYVRGVDDATATATYGRRYVFANLHQNTLSFDTRVNWTLTPKLSLQSYMQPFVAVGRYERFKEFTTPREYAFAVYGQDRGTITANVAASGAVPDYTVDPDGAGAAAAFTVNNPNFNVHSLRGNAVLRWEYRPGSALFFVWQQQRSGSESVYELDANRDVGAIFRERPTNIFLVKAAYWLSR
jgi:hypothetical protein